MNWKRFIAKALGIPIPVVPIFEKINWQQIDAKTWKEFLECDTGLKLIAAMTNHECSASQLACGKTITNREYQAGEVSGLRMQKTMLLLMAKVEEPQKSSEGVKLGSDDYDPNMDRDEIEDLINEASREPVLGE